MQAPDRPHYSAIILILRVKRFQIHTLSAPPNRLLYRIEILSLQTCAKDVRAFCGRSATRAVPLRASIRCNKRVKVKRFVGVVFEHR